MDENSVTQNFYIATESPPADDRTRVLKYGNTFAVFDRYGDIETVGLREEGIFCEGTRFLSQLELRLAYSRPLLLSSTIKADNSQFAADLTNVDISRNGKVIIPRGTLHVLRTKFLWQQVCYERFEVVNYGDNPINVPFSLRFAADFTDIFEVRGVTRERRGERLEDVVFPHTPYEPDRNRAPGGPTQIVKDIILSRDGNHYAGTFTLDAYDTPAYGLSSDQVIIYIAQRLRARKM